MSNSKRSSLNVFYKLNVWIVLALLYSKVRVIFAMRPVHLYGEKLVFSITARHVVNMLKLQCHYASLGKFYKLSMLIVPASLYSKVKVIFALPCSAVQLALCIFLKISRFLRIFNNSIIEDYKLLYTTS